MKKSEFSIKPIFCLDTNILIQMKALLVNNTEEKASMERAGVTSSIRRLSKNISNGNIEAVITPTTLKEVLHGVSYYGYDLVDYIRDNNFLIYEVARNDKKFYHNEIDKLSRAYCTKIKQQEIKKICGENRKSFADYTNTVFPTKVLGSKVYPINDARIMAQATFIGLPLITNNTKDFIYDNRPDIISYINRKYHYKQFCVPYTSNSVFDYLKKQKVYPKIIKKQEQNLIESNDCEFLL